MGCKTCGRGSSTPSGAVEAAHIQTAETTEVRSWTALPLIDINNIPSDLDLVGGSNKEYKAWRIPADYFLPGGTLNTQQYKATGTVEVPEKQVVPVRTTLNGINPIVKAQAASGELAFAIAVSSHDGTTTLMNSGFYTFDRPHMYEVGKTYYLSQTHAGEVVSVKPSAGYVQPLFTVIDQKTISINVTLL